MVCSVSVCVLWVHSPYMHAVDDSPAWLIDGAFTTPVDSSAYTLQTQKPVVGAVRSTGKYTTMIDTWSV